MTTTTIVMVGRAAEQEEQSTRAGKTHRVFPVPKRIKSNRTLTIPISSYENIFNILNLVLYKDYT